MGELLEARLFLLQRVTAMLLAPLVLVHLVVMLYAVHGGLSAAEILSRTQGSVAWALFYGVFVLAVALHAPIGLRSILREWTSMSASTALTVSGLFGLVLLVLGLRAVWAVTA
ncbi:MAG: succinate dehydrogenase [Burkholderiaceae bacterium]